MLATVCALRSYGVWLVGGRVEGGSGVATTVQAVEREALNLLFTRGTAVPLSRLARAVRTPVDEVAPLVSELEEQGRLLRDDGGNIVGATGLSVLPTPHEFVIDGVRRWTWCAWDALGLAALIGRDGVVRSTCPESGAPIEVRFTSGRITPHPATAVLLYASRWKNGNLVADWCPLVNLFVSEDAARSWMARTATEGLVQQVAQAAAYGAQAYRSCLRVRRRRWWQRPPWRTARRKAR
jgi:Alkylmercury lyase